MTPSVDCLAKSSSILGLANANFTEMTFESRAGEYVLDFSGDLQRDANVNIKVGLSNIQILVPPDIPAKVWIDGWLTSVSTNGAWTQKSNQFVNGTGEPQLKISVEMEAVCNSQSNSRAQDAMEDEAAKHQYR